MSPASPPLFAVVVTGPPGAGKTCVLTALADALEDDGIPHAVLEVEALGWTHPALGRERRLHHLRVISRLHREAGHRLLLVADTVETATDLAGLLDAVGAEQHLLVRLEAPPTLLAKRLREREPDGWSGLPGLIERAGELARTMPGLPGVDLVLDTEGERGEALAARVVAALRARHALATVRLGVPPSSRLRSRGASADDAEA